MSKLAITELAQYLGENTFYNSKELFREVTGTDKGQFAAEEKEHIYKIYSLTKFVSIKNVLNIYDDLINKDLVKTLDIIKLIKDTEIDPDNLETILLARSLYKDITNNIISYFRK